jgi:hypothetical protein
MRGEIWVGLLRLIAKPLVVANSYLMGQHTIALVAKISGESIFLLRDSTFSTSDGL